MRTLLNTLWRSVWRATSSLAVLLRLRPRLTSWLWKDFLFKVGRLAAALRNLIILHVNLILIFGFFILMIIFLFFNLSPFSLLSLLVIVLLVNLLLNLRVHTLIVCLGREIIVVNLVLFVTDLILANLVLVLKFSIILLGRNDLITVLGFNKFAIILFLRFTINLISNLLRRALSTMLKLLVLLSRILCILETLLNVFGLEIVQGCVPVVVKTMILHRLALLNLLFAKFNNLYFTKSLLNAPNQLKLGIFANLQIKIYFK